MSDTVGYVGVGDMGGPMALNLMKAGFDVVAYDIAPERLRAVAEAGAAPAASAREVADRAGLVMVCLNTVQAMHAVAGECARGKAIRTYVDLSTSGPTEAMAMRAHFEGTGVEMLDAPVSGHIHRAVDGTLTVMASGRREVFEAALPAFEAIGRDIFYVSDIPGGGQMMKVANNYVNNVQAVGTAEAIVMGMKFGLDPRMMFDVMNVSTGRNNQTEGQMRQAVTERDFSYGAVIAITQKDMQVAMDEAERLGVPATTGKPARAAFEETVASGGKDQRSSAVFKQVAARSGLALD